MEKIKVNARAIVGDIKERMGLNTLMEKHGLSYRHFLKVRDLLLEKGWVAREEFDYLNLPETSAQVAVPAREFLACFRNRPDDYHLMNRFRLTAKDLRRIYERLIQAGLMSEYEYHCRDKKASELEEHSVDVSDASTEVTLLKGALDDEREIFGKQEEARPRGSHPNATHAEKPSSTIRRNRLSSPPATSSGDMHEETTLAVCPNCGCPSDASSPTTCVCCGIVFSKVKRIPANKRVPIWQFDYGIR